MLRGIPTIIKEEDGVVLTHWGTEFVTWIRDINGKLRDAHYFRWIDTSHSIAMDKAVEDYHLRLNDFYVGEI